MTVGPTSLSLLSYLSIFCCRFSWEIVRSWLRMPVTSALMASIWVSSRISMKFHKEKDVTVPKYAKILIVSPELKAFLEFVGFAMTKALLLFGGEANTLSMALSHERKKLLQNTSKHQNTMSVASDFGAPLFQCLKQTECIQVLRLTLQVIWIISRPRHPPLGEERIHRDRQWEALAHGDRGPPHCSAAATARRPDSSCVVRCVTWSSSSWFIKSTCFNVFSLIGIYWARLVAPAMSDSWNLEAAAFFR